MYPRITKALHQQRQHIHRAPLLAAAISAALTTNDDRHDSPSISIPSSFRLATPTDRRRALCDPLPTTTSSSSSREESEPERFRRTLALHRARIADYRSRWEYRMPSSSSSSSLSASAATPARSWPEDIPEDDDLPMLLRDVRYCDRSPNFRSDKDYCARLRFRAACALLARDDDDERRLRGLDMLRTLAEKGYRDAMTYYGMCLNEGRGGVEPNPVAAVSWFRRCSDMYDHAQSQYELGVAYYMGEGVVENGEEAVRWFLRAAEKDHAAACYMLGDCLLDGEGIEMDRALALEWLIKSAELGHRGARSRVMAVLGKKEGQDYGRFTDASRQTLVEHTVLSANKNGEIIQRRTTRVRRIGGGAKNPAEFRRRQTIVHKSREDT